MTCQQRSSWMLCIVQFSRDAIGRTRQLDITIQLSWVRLSLSRYRSQQKHGMLYFHHSYFRRPPSVILSQNCAPFSREPIIIPPQSNYCTSLSETISYGVAVTKHRLHWSHLRTKNDLLSNA